MAKEIRDGYFALVELFLPAFMLQCFQITVITQGTRGPTARVSKVAALYSVLIFFKLNNYDIARISEHRLANQK